MKAQQDRRGSSKAAHIKEMVLQTSSPSLSFLTDFSLVLDFASALVTSGIMRRYLQLIQDAQVVQLLQDGTSIPTCVSQHSLKSVEEMPGDGSLHEESWTGPLKRSNPAAGPVWVSTCQGKQPSSRTGLGQYWSGAATQQQDRFGSVLARGSNPAAGPVWVSIGQGQQPSSRAGLGQYWPGAATQQQGRFGSVLARGSNPAAGPVWVSTGQGQHILAGSHQPPHVTLHCMSFS